MLSPLTNFPSQKFLSAFFVDLARMNHLSRIGKAHSISTAVCDDDGACCFVGFVARPITLKLQEHLYPTREASTGLLQPAKRVVVTGRRETSARVSNNENFETIFERREHGERNASFREEPRDDQPL